MAKERMKARAEASARAKAMADAKAGIDAAIANKDRHALTIWQEVYMKLRMEEE